MSADTRKKIYDILKNKTGFMDSYEDFDNDMTTSEDARKKVYEVLRDKTGFNDTYENFVSGISGEVQRESAIPPAKEESGNVVTTVQSPSYPQRTETKERILNNIPDYFRSRGNDLSTLPLPQNTMSAENPADIPGRIVQDEQQRIQLAERADNDPYMKQQELEHVFKPKNQEQIDSVRQLINSARQERVKERQQRVKSAGGGGIFSTMSQAYLAGEQNDADKQLEYASTLIEQAQNITNEAKKKGNTNFFAGFARGFKDAPLDGWAMGLQDLKNYSAAKKVMDKVDRGEELSPSEDALMQALVTNAATQMYYSGDLGRGYKAGGVTAESLPFMLDMIAGMGTIQAVTKPASKALVKYATEKAAKMGLGRATTGLAKGAARTAAGLGDVAAHTATFGGARVAADYQRRGLGDVQVSPEQDGTVSYAGRDNVQTGAEAIGKSVVSTAAETGSELLGEYFAPMLGWVGKVTGANRLGKIIPASVGKAYSSIINSNGFKQVQEIARRAKIADPIGEYGEEVVNNLVSTAIGDMTPEQLVDLDNNIDTFLGVAPMSALFGAAGTGGYLREKYRNYRNMREFENQMRDTMGEDWSGVREALQDADIETARGMVKEVLSSNMQPDIKKKAINYISSVLQEQTLQEADKQIAPEEMIQNKRFIISNLNEARNNIGIGEEELNSAVSILNQEGESALSELYDAETVQKIVEYKNAYDDYLNYTYWVQNQAYDAREEAESQVERMTNATTGTVMRVKSGLSKNPVNILRGNIVFDAEGNVDKDSSDNTIYYLSEDGKVKMAPISMFESLVDDTPADELSYQAGEDAEQEFIQNEEAQIMQPEQSVQPIELGTTFQSDGVTYSVTQKSPDGYVVSALDEEGNPVQSNLLTEEQIRTAMTPAIQEEQTSQEQFVQNEDITQPEQQQLQTEPQTAISRIPVNENGEHDFESAPYQDTSSALIEISESVDDAKDTAVQMINHYQEELKKADKAKTTGNTIQEIVRLKQQKKANIQSINDKIAYWNSVANDIESKRPGGIIEQAKEESDANQQRLSEMTAEQQQAAQQEVQKKIDSGAYERKEPRKRIRYVNEDNDMGTANTPMEHVLREIATGRVTFKWNDSGETQGLGSHLGLASSPEERRRMIWALSSDGMTPEAAAEQIHADMPENLQGMVTDQDVFNMILDAFHQNGTPSKMWESAKSMHGTDVEESAPGYEDYMERQALEWEASQNNMTVEEWISYVDYVEEELDNMYSSVSDEDLNAIFERFNEQIISENESRGNETEGAGSTEGQTDGEQGDELLPEGRGNNEGADTTVNEQPEPANQADGESGGVVPESEGAVKTEIESARKEVDQNPTEAQKEAGNYKKGHVKVDGFDITIENPKGSVRSGKDADGKEWSVTMNNDYGYIRGTEGVDGDHIDVFLSDNPEQGNVYVIDQVNQKTGEYDESKVMYGFNSLEEAKDAYLANFEEGWKVGVVSGVSKEEFRKWIESSVRKTKPFSEYKSVKVEEAQNEGIRPDEGVLDYAKRVAEREQKKAKPEKKIDVFSYTDAKSNIPAYRGAYYSDGTVTATNGFILIRLQATYPRENEGKVIDKKGEEVANVRYPKVELIIPKGEQETVTVDKESVRAKLNEIETKLKEEWVKSDKKTHYKTLKAITTIKVNIGGVTHNMSIERLTALLDGMDAIGTNQVGITKSIAYAKNGKQLIAVAFNAKDIDDIYDSLSISDETYIEDTINQMKRVGVPLTDLEGIPKSDDGMFQVYGIQDVVGETVYFVSSPGKTVKNMDENYVGTGDRMFRSLDEAIKGAEEERASYQRTKADSEEREERVRQRIEEERKAQETKDATPIGKFLKTLNRLQAGKADAILSDNVSFNGETMSKADFIQRVIADGYAAEEYLDGTKVKYRLVKDGKGYKINKTEFDFAKFAGAETIEVENKDDLINLERLSRKYADKGVYTMTDIDKRIASAERRLKGTNENGKEGQELKKALEELKELKRLKEMQNSGELRFREDDDIRFREDDKNLIAVHNLSEESLQKAFELGGFPMPSIAVTSKELGHTEFGDISLVFDKETINPTNRQNRVYAGDAWTPVFPEINIKISEKVADDIREKIADLLNEHEYAKDFGLHIDNTNLQDKINRSGSFREAYKDNMALKVAFLKHKNINFKPVLVEKRFSSKVDNATLKEIVKATGKEASVLMNLAYDETMQLEPVVRPVVSAYREKEIEKLMESLSHEKRENSRAVAFLKRDVNKELDYSDLNNLFYSAFRYEREGDKKIADSGKTREKLDSKFTKKLQQEFESWLDELSDGIIEKRGIRNERDMFTPSGNRRSWEALYDEITLDNVVNAMRAQSEKGGEGVFGGSIFGAAQKDITSIEELKEIARQRLSEIDSDEYQAEKDEITNRLSNLPIPGVGSSFGSTLDMIENITDAVRTSHTASGIYKYLKKYYPKITKDVADEIASIVKDIQKMNTKYFEAKPYRAVGFDEVKLAVVPRGTNQEVIDKLEKLGIPVKTYKKGDDAARKRILNTAAKKSDLLFRFIGEQGAANLDRAEEATTRLDNLKVAREMESAGKDAKSIKMATGWERGADGKWRYETADAKKIDLSGNVEWLKRHPEYKRQYELRKKQNSAAFLGAEPLTEEERDEYEKLNRDLPSISLKETQKNPNRLKLHDIVDDEQLFTAYPQLENIDVKILPLEDGNIASVALVGNLLDFTTRREMRINKRIYDSALQKNSKPDWERLESAIEHEVQHLVQEEEGFARGGSTRDFSMRNNALYSSETVQKLLEQKYNLHSSFMKSETQDKILQEQFNRILEKAMNENISYDESEKKYADEIYNDIAKNYPEYKEYQEKLSKIDEEIKSEEKKPVSVFSGYKRIAGEVEARNVQSRRKMSAEERRNSLASETEDVAREDQIFLYDSMGASSMVIDANQIAESLNVPVQVINSIDEVPEGAAKEAIKKGRRVKGWYDVKTGKVYVYLPNATSAEDVKQTILHEGIAHFGLRQLVGEERMDDFLDEVFSNVSSEVRRKITDSLPKYGYNSRVATEEYMASIAENGVDVSTWERIKQAFKNLLRRIGINIQINDNELKYILWRSAQNLDKNRPIDLAIDVAMQYKIGVGNYLREGESDGSREEYENSLKGWKYKAREAYQDSMLALKNLQEVIANVSGKPIKSFEDAYKAENQLSSKNTAEAEEYYEKFFKPMLEAEGKMMKNYGLSHKEIERYMMLAHGIERNVEMTFREKLNEIINTNPNDAQQFADDFIMERDRLRNMYSGYEYLKALSDYIGEVGDFSATEAILTSIDNEEHTDFQNDALEYVKDFESKYDTSVLWDKTNRATKETLKKTYESGMMDKDHFANVSKMFMYYVPLRGWNEKTAEDVYEYINSERSPLNSVLKSMKGRKSVPDEVMATIGNMAESAILQGNKNLMKQSFMNMVMNHPTDVATMRKAWYVYDQAKDEWTISIPEIQDNDTPEIISQKISDHEEKMKNLKEKGLATQKSSGLNIDYRILKNNISQHTVVVKNGGKDYIIYVNGNPRAAQAVNGLTNPDAEKNPIFNSISRANRWLAANFTTRNPAFVMSNLARDMIFSMSAIGIKEDAKYSAKFRKNLFVAIPTVFDCIRGKCKNSQSDMYFKEFVKNGGETGYMHLNDVDKYKKKVKKELSKITGERGSAKAALDYTLERLEDFNRWAEDVSRFAVYMTSRQMGRSIVDSVNDAKEVTVNFNKKGAGYKTGGFFGITAGIMRNLYLFFNASVQSLSNFNRLRVKNPVRFYSTIGGFIAAGVIMPVINDFLYNVLGGGDDNPYNDLPEWVRRNNLCIYAGNGQFVTIPLPIELRAFYGLGDYAYQLSTGREKPTPTGIAKGTVSQLADLLPLNPTGNEGLKTFMPDALSPIFETYVWNKDFTGKPIAKLTPFNERDPEWKRVYKGTSGWLVDASKFFNDLTNGGGTGSDFRKGFIDFNPAKVENLLESYFGGMAKFLNQSGKTIYYGAKSMAEGEMDENLVARNVPIVNRFYNKVDDRNAFSGINTEYFNLRDEMEQFKYELNGVKKNYRNNPGEYRQIVNSEMFRKYMRYKPYQDRLDRLYKMAKELEGQERKQVEDMIVEIRRELVNSLK